MTLVLILALIMGLFAFALILAALVGFGDRLASGPRWGLGMTAAGGVLAIPVFVALTADQQARLLPLLGALGVYLWTMYGPGLWRAVDQALDAVGESFDLPTPLAPEAAFGGGAPAEDVVVTLPPKRRRAAGG